MKCRLDAFAIGRLIVLLSCAGFLSAQTAPALPQPVATLDLPESLPASGEGTLTAMGFRSDNAIALETCGTAAGHPRYSQYVARWENGSLTPAAETQERLQWGGRSSSDGRRALSEVSQRKVPGFQHLLESLRTISTLGMSAEEDVNSETVRVTDRATRKSCFEWHRRFPMNWRRGRFATISASGELVAITVKNKLFIYRLPQICEGTM